jgi:adenylate cyclase
MCAACGGENPEGMRFCGHCGAAATAAPERGLAGDVSETLRSFVAQPVAERLVEAGGEIPEERRLITALFADVSGFTSLADRLDPEHLLEVIDPVISGLSSVVGRYEGYVEKFAGDALLALFGAPVSHEDDAERALLVALEMHRELARLCEELPHDAELTLHCGVNSGHGIARILGSDARMDYAVLGDSVILAQRLESAAPKGETYVSDLTYRLTGDRFEFEPVGELTLKGKSEPVTAWRLVAARSTPRPISRKRALIGRERELETIASSIERAQSGWGEVVVVTGEAGVGKSRLIDAGHKLAEAEGFRWLQTRCLSYGAGIAYWPYADLLRTVAAIRPETAPDEAGRALDRAVSHSGAVPYFARLLGIPAATGDDVAALEPEAFRRGLHEGFTSWLSNLTAESPLVLAFEDAHWADPSSLELTRELGRLCERRPLVLYLTARPEAETALEELVPGSGKIPLEPLDETGIVQLVQEVLEGPVPTGLVSWVIERTTGNPFFVEELVRALREHEILERSDGQWLLKPGWEEGQIPPNVEGLLASRIDLLPRPAADALQTASVIGRVIPVPLLAAVRGDEGDLAGVLETLVQRGFLDLVGQDEVPTVGFHHALVHDVAYSRLLRRQRRNLHRRVAEVAETLYGAGDDALDLLARHLYLGEAGAKAVDYLVRAAERARRLYANEEAILHFSRAAELIEQEPSSAEQRTEVLLALADLYELVGRYGDALDTYRQVREIRSAEVQAWAGAVSTLRKRGEYTQALDVADEALGLGAFVGTDLAPIWLEQGWTLSVAGRFREAIDVLETGLAAVADRTSSTAAYMLLQLARAETVDGRLESALSHASEAERSFGETGDVRGLATTMRLLGDLRRNRGEFEEAAQVLRRGLEFAVKTGSVEEIGGCLINLGLVELERGDVHESIASTRRAIDEFERVGQAGGLALGYGNLAYALCRAGVYDDAFGHAERALEIAESIGNAMAVADIRDTIAEILLGQERFAEAAAEAEAAAAQFLEMGATTMATKSLRVAAEAWANAGEPERARQNDERARNIVPA